MVRYVSLLAMAVSILLVMMVEAYELPLASGVNDTLTDSPSSQLCC